MPKEPQPPTQRKANQTVTPTALQKTKRATDPEVPFAAGKEANGGDVVRNDNTTGSTTIKVMVGGKEEEKVGENLMAGSNSPPAPDTSEPLLDLSNSGETETKGENSKSGVSAAPVLGDLVSFGPESNTRPGQPTSAFGDMSSFFSQANPENIS